MSYKKDTHTSLTLTANGKTTTIDTKAWRLPPVDMVGGNKKVKIPTLNCITDTTRVPGTTKVMIKLTHICDVDGDWCCVGGPTWHLVAMH